MSLELGLSYRAIVTFPLRIHWFNKKPSKSSPCPLSEQSWRWGLAGRSFRFRSDTRNTGTVKRWIGTLLWGHRPLLVTTVVNQVWPCRDCLKILMCCTSKFSINFHLPTVKITHGWQLPPVSWTSCPKLGTPTASGPACGGRAVAGQRAGKAAPARHWLVEAARLEKGGPGGCEAAPYEVWISVVLLRWRLQSKVRHGWGQPETKLTALLPWEGKSCLERASAVRKERPRPFGEGLWLILKGRISYDVPTGKNSRDVEPLLK